MKWQKKLTRAELRHLAETCPDGQSPTLRALKANREFHRKCVEKGERDPCIQCAHIARKLGLEDF